MRASSPWSCRKTWLLDGLADALRDHQGARGRRLRQHHHELVAAVAGQDVGLAHRLHQDAAHLGQGARARQVAVRVVDALEAVQVQEDDRERDAVALAALDLAADVDVQVARVEELGEVVGDGELLRALEEDGVLDGDGAGLHQGEQHLQVGLGELAPQLVDDLHHPDGAPAGDEGRAQDGAGPELGLGVELPGEAGVLGGVVDDGGLARLRHPARDALPDLHPERRRRPCPSPPGPARRSAPASPRPPSAWTRPRRG